MSNISYNIAGPVARRVSRALITHPDNPNRGGTVAAPAVLSVEYVSLQAGGSGNPNTRSANLTKGQVAANCVPFATYRVTDGGVGVSAEGVYTNSTRVYDNSGTAAVEARCQWTGSGNGVTQGIYVVEFNPDVIKVQQLSATGTAAQMDLALSEAVTSLNHAFCVAYGGNNPTSSGGGWNNLMFKATLTSTTNLRIDRHATSPAQEFYAYVVEDITGGNYFSVKSVAWSVPGATDTGTGAVTHAQAFSAVDDLTKAMVIGSIRSSNDSAANYVSAAVRLASDSSVEFIFGDSLVNTLYMHAYVIEWADGTTVQRGLKSYTTESTTQAITPVDLTKAIALRGAYAGICGVAVEDNEPKKGAVVLSLSDDSTLSFYSGAGVSTCRTDVGWEVVQFA